MLKANVGLSRKLSENYQSTGFSLNLEGEINATLDDPEAVIQRIKELYDLAEEALDLQIDRHQSDSAIASRDDDHHPVNNGHSNGRQAAESNSSYAGRNGHQNGKAGANGEPATNKQVAFLQTLAKRQDLERNNLYNFFLPRLDGSRLDGVVPFPVELVGMQPHLVHLLLGDLHLRWIAPGVQAGLDLQPRRRGRGRDQFDDHPMAHQRTAAPIPRDVREQPVLDLVPLARARREVADGDLQARLVGEPLKFHLPEPPAIAVAPAAVGADQQPPRPRVRLLAHAGPPLADALDGEA